MINLRVMYLVFIGFVSVHSHVWVGLAELSISAIFFFLNESISLLYLR
jgi:hypothetical protein